MRPGLVLNGVGACVACGRVLDHWGWTTTTAIISISRIITISISITITITLITITLFNNIAYLMLGLAGVIWGWWGYFRGVMFIFGRHTLKANLGMAPPGAVGHNVKRDPVPAEPLEPDGVRSGLLTHLF